MPHLFLQCGRWVRQEGGNRVWFWPRSMAMSLNDLNTVGSVTDPSYNPIQACSLSTKFLRSTPGNYGEMLLHYVTCRVGLAMDFLDIKLILPVQFVARLFSDVTIGRLKPLSEVCCIFRWWLLLTWQLWASGYPTITLYSGAQLLDMSVFHAQAQMELLRTV